MRASIDARDVVVHLQALQKATPEVKRQLWTALRATDVDLERGVKSQMPVDTGRARASWGSWTPSDLVKPNADASAGDAIHEEHQTNLEIVQGTNVRYVPALNAGHSQQAPAGFIDVLAELARVQMVRFAQAIGFKTR